MQALKQAAREGDEVRLVTVCEEWHVPAAPLDLEPADGERESATDPADSALLPDEQIIQLEAIGLVRISLAALDPRSRELVRLKFTEELSYKDIAARTGLTTGNVGFILHQALKTIASELARTGALP